MRVFIALLLSCALFISSSYHGVYGATTTKPTKPSSSSTSSSSSSSSSSSTSGTYYVAWDIYDNSQCQNTLDPILSQGDKCYSSTSDGEQFGFVMSCTYPGQSTSPWILEIYSSDTCSGKVSSSYSGTAGKCLYSEEEDFYMEVDCAYDSTSSSSSASTSSTSTTSKPAGTKPASASTSSNPFGKRSQRSKSRLQVTNPKPIDTQTLKSFTSH
jgi:hypothetical protein